MSFRRLFVTLALTIGSICIEPALAIGGRYTHQVDFFLLNETKRGFLTERLHAAGWCHEVSGLHHDRYGCERFASTLAWAYWPDARNALRPRSAKDESAAMKPEPFRALLTELIGVADPFAPNLQSRPR